MQRVEIVRGTSLTLDITITDASGNAFSLESGQKIVFGVKAEFSDETLLIRKLITTGTDGVFKVNLVPADTESLDAGRYYYDVGLVNGSDYLNVIEPNPFIVKENVTKRGDGA